MTRAYAAWFTALVAAPLFLGGFLVLRLLDREPLGSRAALGALGLAGVALAVVVAAGLRLRRVEGRRAVLATAYFALLALVAVVGAEVVASRFVPRWPALGLHGLEPRAGTQAWGRAAGAEGAVGFNSWGQRDRERSLRPLPGVRRIAFVGDSLLEESSAVPVSLATERLLGRFDLEILNLGVSATQPDEYYYRTRSIALPLGAEHCVLFLYEGNDLSQGDEITLPSLLGVAAVYPRESVLSLLCLRALNHVATNRLRPVVRIWGRAGELHQEEQSLALRLARASDAEMPAALSSLVRRGDRERVEGRLRQRDLAAFYAMLRQPDQGLFRSYYLSAALKSLAAGGRRDEVTPAYAYRWVRRTSDLCRARGVHFTLVIVPEAFQVDDRMRDLWLPLVDMRDRMAPEAAACAQLARTCRGDGMDVVDLHAALAQVPGAYLNPDGHWSALGVEAAARVLAGHLGQRLAREVESWVSRRRVAVAGDETNPSQSAAFCILPWIHLEVVPEGAGKICCVAKETICEKGLSMNVAAHSIEEIRSSKYLRSVRTALADGRKIPVCAYCWGQESRGETSQRQLWNGRFPEAVQRLDAQVRQGQDLADPMPLEYLQISVGNKCNLACRMCNASYSSRIEEDPVHNKWSPRMGREGAVVWTDTGGGSAAGDERAAAVSPRPHWVDKTPWFEQPEFIEKDMMAIGPTLKLLYVTGGEPLFIPAFDQLLEEYVRRGHAGRINISINTNLFHNEGRIARVMELLLKFQYCSLGASIDGYGAAYEYIRYPAKWSVVERNIRALKAQSERNGNLTFMLTTVAQAYNCFNLVDLFRFADELSIECNPHVLEGPPQLRPHVLPRDLRARAAAGLADYAASPAEAGTRTTNRGHAARIAHFLEGIEDDAEAEGWRETFRGFTRDLDQSRGQSLERSVPELGALLADST